MKQKIRKYTLLLSLMLSVLSCEQFQNVSGTKEMVPLSATIEVNLNLGTAPVPDQLQIRLVNFAEPRHLHHYGQCREEQGWIHLQLQW